MTCFHCFQWSTNTTVVDNIIQWRIKKYDTFRINIIIIKMNK